ncbi:MAG: NADH:ubiquinone reductase (Na(+)-transporting) subunit B [Candidatus Lambdaproteobacteria bacterium RIFOXYD12_FULL_49_8]|nr:MAG: NADH:ubiquinone reductase (Na(+)-transporting) subunit B [Candidatus Lambdaproteobacteria bacterium RIFOXYD12_FULL_49_8]
MKPLRNLLDAIHPHVVKGGKFEKLYAIYEMADTFLFTLGKTTKGGTHVKDQLDLKRMMISVVIALQPVLIMATYNTGLQANRALARLGVVRPEGWRGSVLANLGIGFDPDSIFACIAHGLLWFMPIFLVVQLVGGFWESNFALIRGHEINEGFLVTGFLFPLTLPPTIPLWQVALGVSFGVVIGKEVFGGTGKNFLNPALTGRAFLFFAYPAQISGDAVWTAVDGFSGATPLSLAASSGYTGLTEAYSWFDAFVGTIPGSMGETSTLACLLGAGYLLLSGVASWRIMLSVLVGTFVFSSILYLIGSDSNPMFSVPPGWHLVLGGFAFGLVFMATDPVSASMTFRGQFVYGGFIGFIVVMVRVINPAYPEGMMLAILRGNTVAPLIDHYVVKANITRRKLRNV